MRCERCNGLVIAVSFGGGGDDAHNAWEYDGLKCLNCGSITDPLLTKNRELLTQSVSVDRSPSREHVPAIHYLASTASTVAGSHQRMRAVITLALAWFAERTFNLQLFPV